MKTIALTAASLVALALPATAAEVQTKSGKTVWTVDSLSPPAGKNNGGKGKTDKASKGLVNAVTKGGLVLK